jgi:membrane fusion protein (multidrug efflux system)
MFRDAADRGQPRNGAHDLQGLLRSYTVVTDQDTLRARTPAPKQQPLRDDQDAWEFPPVQPDLSDEDYVDFDEDCVDEGRAGHGSFLRRLALALGLALLIPAAAAGYLFWDYTSHFESTDDSFIAARQFAVQPKISGYVTAVPVTDNQRVVAGDVIARIDDRDYRIALDQAQAQLTHEETVLEQAQKNLARYQVLGKTNTIAQQQIDDQKYLVDQDESMVALDQAKVDQAKLNLSYTTVIAPQPGRIVSLNAAVGQFLQPGTTLTMLVPDQLWVTANFKETQLDAMRAGQPVTVAIDAYPERNIRGHVASVQPGSGPAFSLLPSENATGNWVKVVQRVPVKIVMDHPPADVALGPGMSVETTVRTNPNPSLYELLKDPSLYEFLKDSSLYEVLKDASLYEHLKAWL